MKRIALAMAAGAAGVLLSACATDKPTTVVDTQAGGDQAVGAQPAGGLMKRMDGLSCPSADELKDLTPPDAENVLPEEFHAFELVMCTLEDRQDADGTNYQVIVEKHATEGLDTLSAALRKPSEPIGIDVMCTMELPVVPWFQMVSVGDATLRPAIPTDVCGKPNREVLQMLDGLTFSDVKENRVA
jgi:hypothetical protein